jgi:hypothetical protein
LKPDCFCVKVLISHTFNNLQAAGDCQTAAKNADGPIYLDTIHINLPEGGAGWMYFILALATCLGAVFFSSRTSQAARA